MLLDEHKVQISEIMQRFYSGLINIWSTYYDSKHPNNGLFDKIAQVLCDIVPVKKYCAESDSVESVVHKINDYFIYMDDYGLVDQMIQGELDGLESNEESEAFMEDDSYIKAMEFSIGLTNSTKARLSGLLSG